MRIAPVDFCHHALEDDGLIAVELRRERMVCSDGRSVRDGCGYAHEGDQLASHKEPLLPLKHDKKD
jgi:hypothetical protein